MTRRFALAVAFMLVAPTAAAAPASRADLDTQALHKSGVEALERGAIGQAVDDFELLADRGFSHPDVSFNRAVAYVHRARSSHARPGDLGRAVAALSETLALRPDDAVAEDALTRLREEIARKHARNKKGTLVVRPSIARTLVGLLSENAWAMAAAVGSLLLTLGLALRFLARQPTLRLAGALTVATGSVVLPVGATMTLAARNFRIQSDPAIVVVEAAQLLEHSGRPMAPSRSRETSLPEGALVYVVEREGPLLRVEWGEAEGWVVGTQLRLLPDAL
jgi:hypothetical protein